MKHTLFSFGKKPKRDDQIACAEDYAKRIERYTNFEWRWLKEERLRDAFEGCDVSIALDERGESWTSAELARRIQEWGNRGRPRIHWVVGPAEGFGDLDALQPNLRLSLSRMTLPHRLALTLACEQIYRAHTILAGEPYHKD